MNQLPRRQDLHPGRPRFINSGRFTPMLICLLCVGLLAVSWERGRGNIHRIASAILPSSAAPQRSTGPGGEDAIQLERTPDATGGPQLVRAVFLPGRGMDLLQLVASIPGHGEVPLFVAPTLEEADRVLTGTGADANGSLSATMGGAFLVPWAGHLVGRPGATAGQLQTIWLGQHITFPASAPGSVLSTMGLLLDRGADSVHKDAVSDGKSAEAVFHPGTFSGNWPSSGSVRVMAELSGSALELTTTVQNVGSTPMPAGVGWLPYLHIASQNRAQAGLVLPSSTRLETSRNTGIPTGRMLPVGGTALDFTHTHGTALGRGDIDETYVHLSPEALSTNPSAEVRDADWGYGVRLTALSPNIRALRVIAPADKDWVALGMATNFDDALGNEWDGKEGSGIVTLQPGDSVQFKVRLEVFALRSGS